MTLDEKRVYLVKLLIGIGLVEEKIAGIAGEIDKKSEEEIDEIIIKLEQYYQNQNILDKEFMVKLDKINNSIDETIEKTIEKFEVENFSF